MQFSDRVCHNHPTMTRLLHFAPLLLLLSWSTGAISADSERRPGPYVMPCAGVTLNANYVADVGSSAGPGFHFHIENKTAKDIHLAQPVPSSAHWYARVAFAGCGELRLGVAGRWSMHCAKTGRCSPTGPPLRRKTRSI
jgi:hypothetical protein